VDLSVRVNEDRRSLRSDRLRTLCGGHQVGGRMSSNKAGELATAFNDAIRHVFRDYQSVDTRVVCHAAATVIASYARQLPPDMRDDLIERIVTVSRPAPSSLWYMRSVIVCGRSLASATAPCLASQNTPESADRCPT